MSPAATGSCDVIGQEETKQTEGWSFLLSAAVRATVAQLDTIRSVTSRLVYRHSFVPCRRDQWFTGVSAVRGGATPRLRLRYSSTTPPLSAPPLPAVSFRPGWTRFANIAQRPKEKKGSKQGKRDGLTDVMEGWRTGDVRRRRRMRRSCRMWTMKAETELCDHSGCLIFHP